ncbi:hypothetical protein Pcinc_041374 [Petrolisthes cinctipes]|uniref:DDE-1 domain-containing protein n=1 Tax=Petrolisthes cinctipes TaxID=88211 RepID=A0AAE1BKX8_PETCI|nr:hypothetical protein Pcinc_041374 [Petrolisthes cinctipes]
MDQGVCQNMKQSYKTSFSCKLINSDFSVQDFQRSYTIKDAIFDVALAWQDVKEETLRRSWRKLYGEIMFYGDEENEEFAGFNGRSNVVKDIMEVMSSVPSDDPKKMTADDITEWLDVDTDLQGEEELTDEAIIKSIIEPAKPKEEEEGEEEVPEEVKITWKDAAAYFDGLVKFVEQSRNYNGAEVINFHILWNDFHTKRAQAV